MAEDKLLETKYLELNVLKKNYKIFLVKLNVLLITLDEDGLRPLAPKATIQMITDDYKNNIRNYILEKIEIKQNIFILYLDMVQYCIDNDDYQFLLQLIKNI